MKATLRFLGRALMLRPAFYGERFEEYCTVPRKVEERKWETDEEGKGRLVIAKSVEHIQMYWYDTLDSEPVFCAYSGYGDHIVNELSKSGVEVEVENFIDHKLGEPDMSALKGVLWRGRQREILAKLLAYRGGVINCPTAYGKTFIIGKLARVYPKAQIVITVPYADVAKAIFADLETQLWSQIGFVGGGSNKVKRITVAVSKSLHKCPAEANLVLADECHALLTDNYIEKLNRFYRAKLFGFTASPTGRSDKADRFAEAIFGPIIAEVGYQEGVSAGSIVQLEVRMYRITDGPDLSWSEDKTYVDRHGLWQNKIRNNVIAQVVRGLEEEFGPDEQILIMVDTFEHAYTLGQLLPEFSIVTGVPPAGRIAKLKKAGILRPDQEICTPKMREEFRRQFESNTLKRVISNKVWRQGVDFKDLAVLIRADGAASPIDSCQIPGRLSRLGTTGEKCKGVLVDFIDAFTSNLQGRSMCRLRSYRNRGWDIKYYG
jgi:superfamily II DNA or RNA helicase